MFNKIYKSYKLNSDCISVCADPFLQRAEHKYRINVYYILTILETLIRNVDLGYAVGDFTCACSVSRCLRLFYL